MKSSKLYKILLFLDKIFMKLYRVEYNGLDNIPSSGGFILAGNHTNNLDALLLMSSLDREIHFLAKIELFKGIKKYILNSIGIIPVDRSKRNPEAIKKANNYLKNGDIVGIFPEGTINRTTNIIIPFKKGASRMSNDSSVPIIPFSIVGKYKLLKKSVTINFGKPIYPTGDISNDIKILENKVIELLGDKNNGRTCKNV